MADKKSWKDIISFLTPVEVTHEVNGEMLTFRPVSMGTLFEVKTIGAPLVKALKVLFDKHDRDFGSVYRSMTNESGKTADTENIIEPISVEMAKLRSTQQEESIENLIEALLSDNAKKLIGKIIIESIKTSEKFEGVEMPPPGEFMNSIPTTSIVDFLTGVAKANKGVLGPLEDSLTDLWATVQTKIKTAVNENTQPDTETETSPKTKDTSPSPSSEQAD